MKKLLLLLIVCLLLTGCTNSNKKDLTSKEKKIKVAATLDPHSKILEFAKEILREEYDIEMEILILDDYYIFNKALDSKEIDANYFQHLPFFNDEIKANNYEISNIAGIHIEPFGFYSKTISTVSELKENDRIIISNSVSDHGRILSILNDEGIITLKDDVDVISATLDDIVSNPKNLKFEEIKPELLTLAYENNEGALVAINGNYAIQYGLNPMKDAIILESADETNPYVNIVACHSGDENREEIKALIEVLKSDEVKEFIISNYTDGSVIPVN